MDPVDLEARAPGPHSPGADPAEFIDAWVDGQLAGALVILAVAGLLLGLLVAISRQAPG